MSRTGGASRSIPGWAADLIAVLSRDRPAVVTRQDLAGRLEELGVGRDLERTARDLQQLGWFASLHLKGVWAFVPAGEANVTDPYIDLRAWKARTRCRVRSRRRGGGVAPWLPPPQLRRDDRGLAAAERARSARTAELRLARTAQLGGRTNQRVRAQLSSPSSQGAGPDQLGRWAPGLRS